MKRLALTTAYTALVLAGCGGPKFKCPAQDGMGCVSIEEVYTGKARAKMDFMGGAPVAHKTDMSPQRARPGDPIRTDPRILRVWIRPWEDARGNLYDESYTYLVLDTGKWILRSNRSPDATGSSAIPSRRDENTTPAKSAPPAPSSRNDISGQVPLRLRPMSEPWIK